MKHLFTFSFLLLIIISCKKETSTDFKNNDIGYLQSVRIALKDSLADTDYNLLEFAKAVQSRINKDTSFLRIPFKGKSLNEKFVLLQTNDFGIINRGRIINLSSKDIIQEKPYRYDGAIAIYSLNGRLQMQSQIVNGYIEAFHKNATSLRTVIVPAPEYQEMPEVIVVASRSTSGGLSISDYIWLQSFFQNSLNGSAGYYSSLASISDGATSGGGSSGYIGTNGNEGSPYQDPPILIDFENQWNDPAIDIEKYIKCFDAIPDAGATCSIEIFADIPVDNDPNKLFNFESGSPGHTFIQLKKSNGSEGVMQNIGFYPKEGWKTILTNTPIEGKFVDNSQHQFNASIKMDLSPQNFKSTITEIQYLARFIKYDIDNYNCTDFALDVFNKTRADKLEIPLYDVPSNYPSTGTRTPQGLYNKLKSMQQSGHPESSSINIPGAFGWVSDSKGPCN